jgi:hypothetical protein
MTAASKKNHDEANGITPRNSLQAPQETCAQVSFHVKHFCPIKAQNLTRPLTAASPDLVGSIDSLVRKKSGGGGAWLVELSAENQLRCKIHTMR